MVLVQKKHDDVNVFLTQLGPQIESITLKTKDEQKNADNSKNSQAPYKEQSSYARKEAPVAANEKENVVLKFSSDLRSVSKEKEQPEQKKPSAEIIYELIEPPEGKIGRARVDPNAGEYQIVLPAGYNYAFRAIADDFIGIGFDKDKLQKIVDAGPAGENKSEYADACGQLGNHYLSTAYDLRAQNAKGASENFAKAIEYYNKQIDAEPSSIAYAARGSAYFDTGKFESALKDSQSAIKADPGNLSAHSLSGAANVKLNHFKGAIADYSNAINPESQQELKNEQLFLERGMAYQEIGDKNAAKSDYLQVIKIYPKSVEAYLNLSELTGGMSYEGHNADSKKYFEKANEIIAERKSAQKIPGSAPSVEKDNPAAKVELSDDELELKINELKRKGTK